MAFAVHQQIEYPEIEEGTAPRHRFMSSIEQKVEPWDKRYQYLLFAAEPYEVISFKVRVIHVYMRTHELRCKPYNARLGRLVDGTVLSLTRLAQQNPNGLRRLAAKIWPVHDATSLCDCRFQTRR